MTKYAFPLMLLSLGSLMMVSCKEKESKQVEQPVEVCVMVVDSMSDGLSRSYVGEVSENLSLSLGFPLGGRVEKVCVREGDKVRAGQLLATVDKTSARNAYQSAKATLDQAEDAYNRLKQVHDQGSLAEVKWVEMQTNLDKARSMEQLAKKQLEDCDLYAPVAGVVERCDAHAGATLVPGVPAITLLDVHTLSVTFAVPEDDIASIHVGDTATVQVPALENRSLKVKITECGVSASRVVHSYQVKATFVRPPAELLPGMVCKVRFSKPTVSRQGLVIPAKSVQTHPKGQCVWLVRNGKAQRAIVQSTGFVANGVLISDGLQPGDTLVTEGVQKLYPNAPIIVSSTTR
ncbi:MAG: efflux RND transporter periplasmic adaptor subunit [Bacteroidales bacterium]|nr:efflux RND transporter periplasmic adaptor subunit [Bacteroidales bacterium]